MLLFIVCKVNNKVSNFKIKVQKKTRILYRVFRIENEAYFFTEFPKEELIL